MSFHHIGRGWFLIVVLIGASLVNDHYAVAGVSRSYFSNNESNIFAIADDEAVIPPVPSALGIPNIPDKNISELKNLNFDQQRVNVPGQGIQPGNGTPPNAPLFENFFGIPGDQNRDDSSKMPTNPREVKIPRDDEKEGSRFGSPSSDTPMNNDKRIDRSENNKDDQNENQGEMDEKQNAQCVLRAKQGSMQLSRMVRDVETKMKRLQRQGLKTIPTDVTDLVTQLKSSISDMSSATDCDAIREAGDSTQSIMGDLQEKLQSLEQCAFLPKAKKQIDRQFSNIKRDWNRAKTRVARKKDIDFSSVLDEGEVVFQKLQTMAQSTDEAIDQILTTGDCESAQDIFSSADDARDIEMELREKMNTLNALVDAPQELSMLKRQRKSFDEVIKKAKRNNADTLELSTCIDSFDTNVKNIQNTLAKKPLDPETIRDAFTEAENTSNNCRELSDALTDTHALAAPDIFGDISTSKLSL